MKAKTINEIQNFERSGNPLDKLNIGKGPEKYIKFFEDTLNYLNIKYSLLDDGFEMLIWDIKDKEIDGISYISFVPKGLDKNPNNFGWRMSRGEYEKDPFNIINILIERKYGNIKDKKQNILDKIKNLQLEFDYLSEIENKIEEINNTIKEYKN